MLYFNITTLFSGIGFAALVLLTPLFAADLNLSFTQTGIAIASFAFSMIVFSPLWGSLSDRLGKRKIFLIAGSLLFALSTFLLIYVHDFQTLILLRFLQGVGYAATPMLTALFSDHFGSQSARNFSFFSAASSLGWGVGSLLAGALGDLFSVRAVFAIIPVFTIISIFLIHFTLPDHPTSQSKSTKGEGIPNKLFYLFATIFTRQGMAMALWSVFPIYLQSFVNNSLFMVGLISGSNMLFQPAFMLLVGRFAEGREKLRLIFFGIIGTIITFVVYASATQVWHMILGQAMIAFFWSFIFIGINVYLIEEVPQKSRGKAFGYFQAALTAATAIGPLLGGTLSDAVGIHKMILIVSGLLVFSFPFLLRLQYLDRMTKRSAAPSGAGPVVVEQHLHP
ncbi:MFS transporter [Candidatus Acetothermia bacterium]|nr:MFS transporter [Candidatus Acetothermia bacterium]MBI3643913.1 MFS transporter [Candidatus Acetothermia bacterium]